MHAGMTFMRNQLGAKAGLVLAMLLAPLPIIGAAEAARLDKDACEALKTEHANLVGAGVRDQMAKGPEWAKANLPRDALAGIRRLIEVEEQIAFRCERPRPAVVTTAAPAEGEEPAQSGPAHKPAAKAAAVPAEPASEAAPAPTKKKRKPKPPAEAAAPAEAPAEPAAEAAPHPAQKKKTAKKPADAYVPPAAAPDPAPASQPSAQATTKSVKPSTE